MYLAWFDADRKKPVTEKIAEARERYLAKFGAEPAVCLVNPADAVPGTPVELRPAAYISRNCFWIGIDEQAAPRLAPPEEPALPAARPAVPATTASARGQQETPAPRRKRKQSPKPQKPLSVVTTEPARVGTKTTPSAPRVAARKRSKQETQATATPVAPTAPTLKSRKRATVETGQPAAPAAPTGDRGKPMATAPAARRAPGRVVMTAAAATVDTKATGRKPARAAEPAQKSSKGKRQPAPSVMQSRKDAPPVRVAARDLASKPAAKDRPTQVPEAPKSSPAKPRKLAEVAKGPAATKTAGAKPPTAARPRREQPAA